MKGQKALDTHTPSFLRKITAPALPTTIVQREALVRQLNEAVIGSGTDSAVSHPPYKLILVDAPAGYGKTTLLAEFARQCSLPFCWYLLDRHDTHPLAFLRLVLASLRQQFPAFGTQLDYLLYEANAEHVSGKAYAKTVLIALLEAIATEIPTRFVLQICNYQEINEHAEITQLIEHLLHHLPDQCVLVLESRAVPGLDFAALLADRAMLGVGRDLLRFSPQEIRTLAQLQGSRTLSEEEAEQMATAFDGWITGLLLGTHLGGAQILRGSFAIPLPRVGLGVPIHAQNLSSYVVNEVFKHHQMIYGFLREMVILQEMTPDLCARLLDLTGTEARHRLQYLERHGLFVTHSGEDAQQAYICHPALRNVLYEELRQQAPDRFVQLHRRAADLLRAAQCYERAIYHAMEAGVDEIAARLIIESADQMIEQGHSEILEQWIMTFSEEITRRYPRLLLIQASIFLRKSELFKAFPLLEAITEILNSQTFMVSNKEGLPLLQAELALARVLAFIQQGKYQQAYPLCQQVLAHLPADEANLRAKAHRYCGVCAGFLGDLVASIGDYQKALQLWGRHTISRNTADGHTALADAYRMSGHFALAEHHSARATACWKQLQDIRGTVNNLTALAELKRDQGGFSEAETILQQALALASRPPCLHRLQSYALVSLGELYQDQGAYDRSLSTTEEALALARQLGDSYLLNSALRTLALTYLYTGDSATATLLLSERSSKNSAELPTNSIEHILRELSIGAILLYQHRYSEALAPLTQAEVALNTMGFKRDQLKALVRLAACHWALKQQSEFLECLAAVEAILAAYDGYEHRVLIELRTLPQLQQIVQTMPECATLRTLLHWETNERDLSEEEQEALQQTGHQVAEGILSSPSRLSLTTAMATPRLKIQALGEPVVLLNAQPITRWRMARAMELCFYLLECARPMRKEQLITALWTEMGEQSSQTFYSTIHYLRKALGGESTITSRAGVYTLDLASVYGQEGVWYDVAVFEEQYTLGKQALVEEEDEAAREAFAHMVELYRGDYVQPFYSDWSSLRRDELRRAYLDARLQLAHIAWRAENFEESASHWQQMLVVDNCLEEAHYGLMRCYIRQGKRGPALRQYQRCIETLQREWGVVPGSAIQNLHRRLVSSPKAKVESP
jgi:ATP/maltotriose-dependent transcriptional regulator MalT/two-component SAPR family response regulator